MTTVRAPHEHRGIIILTFYKNKVPVYSNRTVRGDLITVVRTNNTSYEMSLRVHDDSIRPNLRRVYILLLPSVQRTISKKITASASRTVAFRLNSELERLSSNLKKKGGFFRNNVICFLWNVVNKPNCYSFFFLRIFKTA